MRGRYYDLYTKQHGLETNLFLAPGEGDIVVENGNGLSGRKEAADPDALKVIRGEVR
jgi:subfamily B ATP-binding cassette protein MsbA